MCGITGWIDWNEPLALRQPVLEQMTESLAHRGPDASGVWISGPCALGHRRLSVIDPENGAQPMIRRADGTEWVIVYNGELYNTAELREELKAAGAPVRHQLRHGSAAFRLHRVEGSIA